MSDKTDVIQEIQYVKKKLPLNGEIIDLSDLHIPEHVVTALNRDIKHLLKAPKKRFAVFGGDLIDAFMLNNFAQEVVMV